VKFGWIPDVPDHRDLYRLTIPAAAAIPKKADLRPSCPPIVDQLDLGSCTACAVGAAHWFEQRQQNAAKAFAPSRLDLYYFERALRGTTETDSGATIRDGFKTIAKRGVCPETLWPYVPARFDERPPKGCDEVCQRNQALRYTRVQQTADGICAVIAAGQFVVFGFSVYESFMGKNVAQTGIVPMPAKKEKMLGGHAVAAVGYDRDRKIFIVRNSWGAAWGQAGYCQMPFQYLLNDDLAADFWCVSMVEGPAT
jgi:C1A family cysteine protease